jgi:hypothetical protein
MQSFEAGRPGTIYENACFLSHDTRATAGNLTRTAAYDYYERS